MSTPRRAILGPPPEQHDDRQSGSDSHLGQRSYSGKPLDTWAHGRKYDYARHEPLPISPSTCDDFHKIEKLLDHCASELLHIIPKDPGNARFQDLIEELNGLRQAPYGKPKRVGLAGETGSGKSALISALLGHVGLVESRDDGNSCTQVVIEFLDSGHGKDQSCRAEIKFKKPLDIQEDIRHHVEVYETHRQHLVHGKANAERDREEYQDDLIGTAADYLTQVFPSRFSDADSLAGTFAFMVQKSRDHLLKELTTQAERLIQLENHELSAGGVQDLMTGLKRYMTTQRAGCQTLWPLVDHIEVYISSPLLRQGFTIADCPGLTDTNPLRREATQRYLEACDIILMPVSINRILDDQNLPAYMGKFGPLVGIRNVLILPTKCEDAMHNPDSRNIPAADDAILKALEVAYQTAVGNQQRLERGTCSAKKMLASIHQVALARTALTRQRVLLRNSHVVRALSLKHQKTLPADGAQLTIIPVSSHSHGNLLLGTSMERTQVLGKDEDGIAEVRSKLCARARSAHVSTLQMHISDRWSVFLNNLKGSLLGEPTYDVPAIETAISNGQLQCEKVLILDEKTIESMIQSFMQQIDYNLSDPEGILQKHLRTAFDLWNSKWQAGPTFRAFAEKNGVHRVRRERILHDLNQQGILPLHQFLATLLNGILDAIQPSITDSYAQIDTTVEDMGQDIKSCRSCISLSTEVDANPFWTALDIRTNTLKNMIWRRVYAATSCLRREGLRTLGGRRETAYNKAMYALWEEARQPHILSAQSGKGAVSQRWSHMHMRLRSRDASSPVRKMHDELRNVLIEEAAAHQDSLKKDMLAVFDDIKRDATLNFNQHRTERNEAEKIILRAYDQHMPHILTTFEDAKAALRRLSDSA